MGEYVITGKANPWSERTEVQCSYEVAEGMQAETGTQKNGAPLEFPTLVPTQIISYINSMSSCYFVNTWIYNNSNRHGTWKTSRRGRQIKTQAKSCPVQTNFLDILIQTFSHNNKYIIGYTRIMGSIKSFTKPPQLRDILSEVLRATRHSTTLANVVQESNLY